MESSLQELWIVALVVTKSPGDNFMTESVPYHKVSACDSAAILLQDMQ